MALKLDWKVQKVPLFCAPVLGIGLHQGGLLARLSGPNIPEPSLDNSTMQHPSYGSSALLMRMQFSHGLECTQTQLMSVTHVGQWVWAR